MDSNPDRNRWFLVTFDHVFVGDVYVSNALCWQSAALIGNQSALHLPVCVIVVVLLHVVSHEVSCMVSHDVSNVVPHRVSCMVSH